jgi:hypothetical protein
VRSQARLLPDPHAAQVDVEVVQIEHPHPAGTPLDRNRGVDLVDDQVEQRMALVEEPFGRARRFGTELRCDVAQRPLEVGGQLARIAAGGATGESVPLHEQHAVVGLAQDEERRGDSGDARTDDDHVGRRVAVERLRRRVRGKLRKPRRPIQLVRVRLRCP